MEPHALEQVAQATIEVEDLAQGIIGHVEVHDESLDEIRRLHSLFSRSPNWIRMEEMEIGRYTDKIDYRVYRNTLGVWATIEAGWLFGPFAFFKVTRGSPV